MFGVSQPPFLVRAWDAGWMRSIFDLIFCILDLERILYDCFTTDPSLLRYRVVSVPRNALECIPIGSTTTIQVNASTTLY